jgi:3-oxoadipate enol-lactonase
MEEGVMPKAAVQDVRLYYEVHGSGTPLVLIRGLGSNADHWDLQVPAFCPQYAVVVFDNRGIARSEGPNSPLTISLMASDTVGLMDALGIVRAHVLGISMGGMIAQEIALNYPERVNGLILACTHCGGSHFVQAAPDIVKDLTDSFLGGREAARKVVRCLFSPKTIQQAPDVIERYGQISKRFPPSSETLVNQLNAIQGHDTWERLVLVRNPTLVLTGSDDVLVPPENSRILADRIAGARLQVIENGGHQFLIERPEAFNRAVLEFLRTLPRSS